MADSRRFDRDEQTETNRSKLFMRQIARQRTHDNVFHVFRDTRPDRRTSPLTWFAVGCHGDEGGGVIGVAELMMRIADGGRPDFVVLLGDNVYPSGVTSADSSEFDTKFYQVFDSLLKLDIPFFVILGNHDGDYRNQLKTYIPGSEIKHKEREMNQVAHTFLKGANHAMITRNHFHLSELRGWIMPDRWFSFVFHGNDTAAENDLQLIFMNSNCYLQHYLKLEERALLGQTTQPEHHNQAQWLSKVYHEGREAGRTIVLAGHHPHTTIDKRHLKFDTDHYVDAGQKLVLSQMMGNTTSFNALQKRVAAKQGIKPDLALAAHTHAGVYIHDGDYAQATLGCGGGTLQAREYYGNHGQVGCYIDEFGFGKFTFKHDKTNVIEVSFYTRTDAGIRHIKFTNQSARPIVVPNDDPRVGQLRRLALTACEEYHATLQALQDQMPVKATYRAVAQTARLFKNAMNRAMGNDTTPSVHARGRELNAMMNFLKQHEEQSFTRTRDKILLLLDKMHDKSQGSLYALIQHRISLFLENNHSLSASTSSFAFV